MFCISGLPASNKINLGNPQLILALMISLSKQLPFNRIETMGNKCNLNQNLL